MAHLFFSYAHVDYERLNPIHQQMELMTERMIWIDRIGLQRDTAWETMIKRAVESSYGVVFAITRDFVNRPFILEQEIPWAVERFNNSRQGKLLFPVLFDDVPLPDALSGSNIDFVTRVVDARDGNFQRAIEELKHILPTPQEGDFPFIITWPRLPNFKGRDQQLIALHSRLHTEDGRVAIKTAGLYGTGGIGKTQLAVEFAYRYRFYFPGGVYWLNAAQEENWARELADCADRLHLPLTDPSDPDRIKQKVLAFERHLKDQKQDALIVLDNVTDPTALDRREIAPKLTFAELCRQTPVRLVITTRIQELPTSFVPVEVSKLQPEDALDVLLAPWHGGEKQRGDSPDEGALREIGRLFDYLPLPLGWMAAALRELGDLAPLDLLTELREEGVDKVISTLQSEGVQLGTPGYYEALISPALNWQIAQLNDPIADTLLALLAAFDEVEVVPAERLRLLSGIQETRLRKPFTRAIKALVKYSLVEPQQGENAFRMHALTRQHVRVRFDAPARLAEAAPAITAAYRTPEILDSQIQARGFADVLDDLIQVQESLPTPNKELDALARLLMLEADKLWTLPRDAQPGYVMQQIRNRAHYEGDDALETACDAYLKGQRYFRVAPGSRYPASGALLRVLRGHGDSANGAVVLANGCFVSWSGSPFGSKDNRLRLWSADGMPLAVLEGHTDKIYGALALDDGRILSWSSDSTLRLWESDGTPITTLVGHTYAVNGALVFADGRILSWSSDDTLRLWQPDGTAISTLTGHSRKVSGALVLDDGRILSWSNDRTLYLWSAEGKALAQLKGHGASIGGAFQLIDGRILSWSGDRTLRLWQPSGMPIVQMKGHTASVTGACVLDDSRILSWSNDRTLHLWQPDGTLLATLKGHNEAVTGAIVLRDGRFISWSKGHSPQLWQADGKSHHSMNGHTDTVQGVSELPDGRLLSWSSDRTLRLWSADGTPLSTLEGHTGRVNGALADDYGRILSWAYDRTLRLWQADATSFQTSESHSDSVKRVMTFADGRILSRSGDNTLRLWQPDGTSRTVIRGHEARINGTVLLNDERILSWSSDRTLRLWQPDGTPITTFRGHTSAVNGVLLLSDSRLLSWSHDRTLRLWQQDGTAVTSFEGHTDYTNGALELADGHILSWSGDHTLCLWDMDGTPLKKFKGHSAYVRRALELDGGHILSWSGDKTLRLWQLDGKLLATLKGHTASVGGANILPDGQIVSFSDDGTLRLWQSDGTLVRILEGHTAPINGLYNFKDGRLLSWSDDGKLRFWAHDGTTLDVLEGHTASVKGALVLADGRILSWGSDSTLRLWQADGTRQAVYHAEASITSCVVSKQDRIVFGDRGGRVVVLDLVDAQ